MTGFLLVRHASCEHVGRRIAGRGPGVHLDEEGRGQAEALGRRLARAPLTKVVSGPLERARETAAAVAERSGLEVEVSDAFDEVDYGAWTGRDIDELDGEAAWRWWNEARGVARPPGGETMVDVVRRSLAGMEALREGHPNGWVALVSHKDVIRPVVAHLMGVPLDLLLRIEVAPASVTTVVLEDWGARVVRLNEGEGDPWA